MATTASLDPPIAAPLRLSLEKTLRVCVFVCVLSGIFVAVEPSPYDLTSLLAMGIWLVRGFTIHRSLVLPLFLLAAFNICGFAALMPYWDEATPRLYQFQSLYLMTTFVFFAIYCSEQTIPRLRSILLAYVIGSVVSSILGLLSYVDAFGLGFLMPYEGRIAGTFKDPNLFGSYLVLAANVLLQGLITARGAWVPLIMSAFAVVMAGVLFSFSRGSWGATIVSLALVFVATWTTTPSGRLRTRILLIGLASLAAVAVLLSIVLATTDVGSFLIERAKVTQDYDEGVTGRFGNQMRSIPMLLERFWGFGPLRFRLIFDLEPHNSFIGAFANDGWIGGCLWIVIVVSTCVVGFRLMVKASPVRPLAQVVVPAAFVFFMQGFQIDIDHWRQLFLCIGAIWGLEAARLKEVRRAPAPALRAAAASS